MAWRSQPQALPAARGYGPEHRKARAAKAEEIKRTGGAPCVFCGRWIRPTEPWHLDHTPDRTAYRGIAHPACNRSDGARRGAQRSRKPRRRWAL